MVVLRAIRIRLQTMLHLECTVRCVVALRPHRRLRRLEEAFLPMLALALLWVERLGLKDLLVHVLWEISLTLALLLLIPSVLLRNVVVHFRLHLEIETGHHLEGIRFNRKD